MNACGGNGLRATGIKEQLETESKHRNEENVGLLRGLRGLILP